MRICRKLYLWYCENSESLVSHAVLIVFTHYYCMYACLISLQATVWSHPLPRAVVWWRLWDKLQFHHDCLQVQPSHSLCHLAQCSTSWPLTSKNISLTDYWVHRSIHLTGCHGNNSYGISFPKVSGWIPGNFPTLLLW